MLRKCFLFPAFLSVALMLGAAGFAEAQRGRGWGWGRGGYSSRNDYPGAYYRSYSYAPYWYGGYGNTWYPRGWLGYGTSWSNPYWYTTYPQTSYYYSPSTTYSVEPSAVANAARIRVLVPDASAQVWFDGTLTQQTGTDRLFHTPALHPGVSYGYTVLATWMEGGKLVSRESTVGVMAGQTSVVDFTRTTAVDSGT